MLLPLNCIYANHTSDSLIKIYLFPGQSSDYRLFSKLNLGSEYQTIPINYPVPDQNVSMDSYASLLVEQIDTNSAYIFIGVSLGGMISTELTNILTPLKTIIISSAKNRSELPFRYRILKYIPIYKIIPATFFKAGIFIAQPLFEPDRKHDKDTFVNMLRAKNPRFLKFSTGMIVNWNHKGVNENIIHIHGTNDHTLPYRRIIADYTIQDGSHMMVLTRAEEVNQILNSILLSINE